MPIEDKTYPHPYEFSPQYWPQIPSTVASSQGPNVYYLNPNAYESTNTNAYNNATKNGNIQYVPVSNYDQPRIPNTAYTRQDGTHTPTSPTSPTVVVNVVNNKNNNGNSEKEWCPVCHENVSTYIDRVITKDAMIWCIVLLFVFAPLFWVPLVYMGEDAKLCRKCGSRIRVNS